MHSFVLLTLASSAFAIPVLTGVAKVPVDIKAPVDAAVGAAAKVAAPVKAAVGNADLKDLDVLNDVASGNSLRFRRAIVNTPIKATAPVDAAVKAIAGAKVPVDATVANAGVKDIKGLNGIASGNNVEARGIADVADVPTKLAAPVDAAVGAAAEVLAPVKAAVGNVGISDLNIANGIASGNKFTTRATGLAAPALPTVIGSAQTNVTQLTSTIQGLLASTPAGSALVGPLTELNSILSSTVNQLGLLNGLGVGALLQDGEASISTQQAAEAVSGLTKSVTDVMQQVTAQLGTEVPELQPVFTLLNGSIGTLVSTVTSLVPGLSTLLAPLLTPVSSVLNSLGLGIGLSTVGL